MEITKNEKSLIRVSRMLKKINDYDYELTTDLSYSFIDITSIRYEKYRFQKKYVNDYKYFVVNYLGVFEEKWDNTLVKIEKPVKTLAEFHKLLKEIYYEGE